QEVLHDLLSPLCLLQDHTKIAANDLWKVFIVHQQVSKTQDSRKRIIDFVCYAGNQLAHSSHLFRMHEFCLQRRGISHVCHNNDYAADISLLITHRAQIHRELSDRPITAQDVKIEIVYLLTFASSA